MKPEGRFVPVGEVAASISDTHPMKKERLIFLNTSDILHGKVLHHDYTAVKDWPGQAKKSVRRGDILFSEIRPANGRWALIDEDADDFVVSTKLMVIRPRSGRVHPRYLYQYLTSSDTTRWLQHLAESRSGTFPQITFDQVSSLEIPLPPLSEQHAIAHILGTLDDKIELNRKMNETLEEMARAVFKSWFVDFDPVIDNALRAGKPIPPEFQERAERRKAALTKSEKVPTIGKLFPDEFQSLENGWVPKGWRVQAIGDVLECVGGGTPSTKESAYWDNGVHFWATPKDLSGIASPILIRTERKITDAGLGVISSGLLPKYTVLLSSRAPVGYLAIADIPLAINQGFIAIKPNDQINSPYILNWCISNMDQIKGRATLLSKIA